MGDRVADTKREISISSSKKHVRLDYFFQNEKKKK